MNPTAEDILNSPFRKFILESEFKGLTKEEEQTALDFLAAETFIKYAEEYSLLKSKEAASEGFDAGHLKGKYEGCEAIANYLGVDMAIELPDKETYMKKYDTTGS